MTVVDTTAAAVKFRPAKQEDAAICGEICYEAFAGISARHGFPTDFPSPAAGAGLMAMLFGHPGFYKVVAEQDGRIVGSNNLDERSPIAGVGPITVDPRVQSAGVGRALMENVLERAQEVGFAGVRLVQAAYNSQSLSLYSKLGFQVREPLAVMQGPPMNLRTDGYTVRPARMEDLDACNRVCARIHGHDRAGELRDAIAHDVATVVERDGEIRGYTTTLGFFGHSVAVALPDMQALIGAAPSFAGTGILVPVRNAALFHWCLEQGLRVVQSLNLMTLGLYNEPAGPYLPSITY